MGMVAGGGGGEGERGHNSPGTPLCLHSSDF